MSESRLVTKSDTPDLDLVSPGEAALILRKNPRTIARWADDGTLPVALVTTGKHRRFHRSDVEALAAELAGAA